MKKILIATAIVVGFSGNGICLTSDAICNDCYKCVEYAGSSCVKCEYDINYCSDVSAGCISDKDCGYDMRCNDKGVCEYFAELEVCQDGAFLSEDGCVPCPRFGDAVTSCSPHSGDMDGITSCYYSNNCVFSDKTGTFVLTDNCEYSE